MKNTRLLIVALVLAVAGTVCLTNLTGCSTPPSERVAQYKTLRAAGEAAKTAMDAATTLLKEGSISIQQWQRVADFFDHKWQPAFKTAVIAAQADLSSLASPDLSGLLIQLLNLSAELSTHKTK